MYPLERLKGLELPRGYEPSEGNLRVKSRGGRAQIDFLPENKRFSDYNIIFYGILSKHFEAHPHLSVLDIGGGYQSLAVLEMMAQFPYLAAINVDLFAENTQFSRQGNAANLPIESASIDVVVSVNCASRFLISLPPEGKIMAGEVARVLKHDGLVFLFPSFDLRPVSSELEAVIQLYDKNTYASVHRKL